MKYRNAGRFHLAADPPDGYIGPAMAISHPGPARNPA